MANRTEKYRPTALGPEYTLIAGAIITDGSGAVTGTRGRGFAGSKPSGTGIYRATLSQVYPGLVSATATVLKSGAVNTFVHVVAVDLAAKTVDFQVMTAGSAANLATGEINFVIVVRDTGVV